MEQVYLLEGLREEFEEFSETINGLDPGERGVVEKLNSLDKWSKNAIETQDVEDTVKSFGELYEDNGSSFVPDLAFLEDSVNSKDLW